MNPDINKEDYRLKGIPKERLEQLFPSIERMFELSQNNEGYMVDRIKNSPLEKAFHDLWMEENDLENNSSLNYGCGKLQDLFIGSTTPFPSIDNYQRCILNVDSDPMIRFVVATVIQWLGTNMGRGFTELAYKRAGYLIRVEKLKGREVNNE